MSLHTVEGAAGVAPLSHRADDLLILLVVAAGFAAAQIAEPLLWVATPIVLILLFVSSRREHTASTHLEYRSPLPAALLRSIDDAYAALPPGSARSQLESVVVQATAVYAARDSAFTPSMERETRDHVDELVECSCTLALELARLDDAIPAARTSGQVRARAVASRELLTGRLGDAAASLAALVASGMARGTPAAERIGELVSEIKSDAAARVAARDELDGIA